MAMRIRKLYLLEKVNSDWAAWLSKKRSKEIDEHGLVTLGKHGQFGVDPHKIRQWTLFKSLKKGIYHIYFYQEGKPEPVEYLHDLGDEENDLTPKIIERMGKSRKIAQLMESGKQPWDIIKVALLMSLFINAIVIVFLIARAAGKA